MMTREQMIAVIQEHSPKTPDGESYSACAFFEAFEKAGFDVFSDYGLLLMAQFLNEDRLEEARRRRERLEQLGHNAEIIPFPSQQEERDHHG